MNSFLFFPMGSLFNALGLKSPKTKSINSKLFTRLFKFVRQPMLSALAVQLSLLIFLSMKLKLKC